MSTNMNYKDSNISNKPFEELDELAKNCNWSINKTQNELVYKSKNNKKLIFRFYSNYIEVSIPLKESNINYYTKIDSYFEAIEYGVQSFKYFNDMNC